MMKFKVILIFLLFSSLTFSQDYNLNKEIENYDKAEKYLFVKILPADYKKNMTKYLFKEDFEGTISVVVFNFPEGEKFLDRTFLAKWNMTLEEVFSRVLRQSFKRGTRKLLKQEFLPGEFIYVLSDPVNKFFSSNIYDLSSIYQANSGFGNFISLPAENYLIILPLNNKEKIDSSLKNFMILTESVYKSEEYGPGITTNVYWYYNGEIYPVKYEKNGTKEIIKLPDELIKLM